MKNLIKRVGPVGLSVMCGIAAFAQTSGGGGYTPPDYSASIGTYTTDLGTFLSTNAPALLLALIPVLGFFFVWRLLVRAFKGR